jgi:sortase B
MFGRLEDMKTRAVFDRVAAGTLYTPGKTYRLDIFAAAVGGSRSAFYDYAFPDTAAKQAHLDYIRQNARFYRDIGITAADRVLSLSTCSYEYQDARTIVFARLTE